MPKAMDGLNCLQSLLLKLCRSDFCFRLDTICPGGTQLSVSQMARLNFCLRQTPGSGTVHPTVQLWLLTASLITNQLTSGLGAAHRVETASKLYGDQIPASPPSTAPSQVGWETSTQQGAVRVIQDLSLGVEA